MNSEQINKLLKEAEPYICRAVAKWGRSYIAADLKQEARIAIWLAIKEGVEHIVSFEQFFSGKAKFAVINGIRPNTIRERIVKEVFWEIKGCPAMQEELLIAKRAWEALTPVELELWKARELDGKSDKQLQAIRKIEDAERVMHCVALHKRGFSVNTIAYLLDIKAQAVYRALKSELFTVAKKVEPEKSGSKKMLNDEQHAELLKDRAAGMKYADLAKKYGVAMSIAWLYANAELGSAVAAERDRKDKARAKASQGFKRSRQAQKVDWSKLEEIAARRKNGEQLNKLAKEYGINQTTLCNKLRELD